MLNMGAKEDITREEQELLSRNIDTHVDKAAI